MNEKRLLTEREWALYEADLSGDEEKIAEFGDAVDLLRRSIQAKLGLTPVEPPPVYSDPVPEEPEEGSEAFEARDALDSVVAPTVAPVDLRIGERVYYKPANAVYRVAGITRGSGGIIVEVRLTAGEGRAVIKTTRDMVARVAHNRVKRTPQPIVSPNFRPQGVRRFDRD